MANTRDKNERNGSPQEHGAEGGRKRSERMTPEARSASARLAAQTRWSARKADPLLPKETHGGTLDLGGVLIPCAVLDNGMRVLPTRAVTRAFGSKKTGSDERSDGAPLLPPFLASEAIKPHISEELLNSLRAPVVYWPLRGGRTAFGYDGRLLPRICRVVLQAQQASDLKPNQKHLAVAAGILVSGLGEVGIIALIDEATGYEADKAKMELQQILKAYVAEEMLPWLHRFPTEFFKQVYRLQGWEFKEGNAKRPAYVGKLINEWIYKRLPEPVLPRLREMNPAIDGRRKFQHHRFLTDGTGIPHLDRQIAVVTALMRAAKGDKPVFEQMLIDAFPVHGDQIRLALHRPKPS